ncbi:hypothetical protein PAXINDRAFT_11842 [Paxillus involutus ATCC 200175]|uniref:Transmembrane protein n=1 Tax=Paxillus involutus ATCC 200175 TaxID=664439 RepID=A0A0C9SYY9_PAXIN|nr:hypothetical protein PAXINDRAFT_11842 [Paxillus involutus ATCC 200175]
MTDAGGFPIPSVPPCLSRLPFPPSSLFLFLTFPSLASSSLRVFVLRVDGWGGRTRGACQAVDAWCRRTVFGVDVGLGCCLVDVVGTLSVICHSSALRLLVFPHLPRFSSSPLPFPPSLTSSSLHVFVLCVNIRCLAWTWGWADVSWTWWARRLPAIVSSSVICCLSALCLLRLPFSPSFLFVSLSLPHLFVFRVFALCVDTAGVAVLAVHARLLTPCIDARCLTWGWGLVDAKGVDVEGTPSALCCLVVCRSSALRPRLPFSLGFLHLLTFSLPPRLFVSLYTHAACQCCWGGRTCGAARLSTPCVEVTDEAFWS